MSFVSLHVIVHSVLILLCFLTDRTDEESFGIFFVRVGHVVEESSGNDFKFTKLSVMAKPTTKRQAALSCVSRLTTSSNNASYVLPHNTPPA